MKLYSVEKRCAAQKRYRDSHREILREKGRAYWTSKRPERLEYSRQYRLINAERIADYRTRTIDRKREVGRARYLANRDHILSVARDWKVRNRDRRLAQAKEYQRLNSDLIKVKQAKYRAENKEKLRLMNAHYRSTNRDELKAYHQNRYELNKEAIRALGRLYYMKNRETYRSERAIRRALLKRAPGVHTKAEWQAKLKQYGRRCAYCGDVNQVLTLDHSVPLSRGGSNDIRNIVPACRSCNCRKQKKTPVEFLESRVHRALHRLSARRTSNRVRPPSGISGDPTADIGAGIAIGFIAAKVAK